MIQNFLTILVKFGSTFLFVLLELLCFYLIVNNNNEQSAIWSNSSSIFVGNIYKHYDKLTSFIQLSEKNDELALENASLRVQLLERNFKSNGHDSLIASNFEYIPAIIINNSIQKINNRITLNLGRADGIEKGMGVISKDGIIGVISYVSEHFSSANSVLNIQSNFSGLIKRTRTLGDLKWSGKNPTEMNMNSVPQYVDVQIGDSIVTSGYSTVFPKGQMIGTVSQVDKNTRTGYNEIEVKLSSDLASAEYVYIIRNIIYKEIKDIEEKSEDE